MAESDKQLTQEEDNERKLSHFVVDAFEKATKARSNSGIESTWSDAKRAFDGEFEKESDTDGVRDRSEIFVQLTRSKCVAALASIVSTVFQKGTLPYEILPPEIADSINDYLEFIGFDMSQNLTRMSTRIEDQIKEANVRKKVVLAILDMIVYGTCFIRVPVSRKYTRTRYDVQTPEGINLPTMEQIQQLPPEEQGNALAMVRQLIAQAGKFVMEKFTEFGPDIEVLRVWDAFPDPDSRSSDVQEGDWIIHRSIVTRLELLRMVDDGIFTKEKVLRVLDDGEYGGESQGANVTSSSAEANNDPDFDYSSSEANHLILRYSGSLSLGQLREFLSDGDETRVEGRPDDELVEAVITVIGEELMEVELALDADGLRQYQLCPYEAVPNTPWGRGIPQNVKDTQSLVNGFTRTLVEAKKMSSSVQAIMNPGMFRVGEDGKMYPRKVWKTNKAVDDVRKAISWFTAPDSSAGTLEAIAMFKNMADEHSGMPRVLEGQQSGGAASRSTAFEISQVVNSANMQLDNVIRNLDEYVISRIVRGFYKWNMEVSEDMGIKGDYTINATGFQSFKDQQEKAQKIDMVLGGLAQDPELRSMLNMEDLLRARLSVIDMDRYMYNPQELQQIRTAQAKQAQAQAEAEKQRLLEEDQRKFDQAVLKKSEVQATKDDIQKERDIDDAIQEREDAEAIAQFTSGGSAPEQPIASGTNSEIAAELDRVFAKIAGNG